MEPLTTMYFEEIDRHVIRPLESTSVKDHCFASALLIFGAMDGTGFLVHEKPNPGNRERLRAFLNFMDSKYEQNEFLLWNLRNDLVHTAMNVAAFMSRADCARDEHLQPYVGGTLVHTGVLFEDFRNAIEKIKVQLDGCTPLSATVEGKLTGTQIMDPMDRQWKEHLTTPRPYVSLLVVKPPRRKRIILECDGGSWRAEIPDVNGCIASGLTPSAAVDQLRQWYPTEIEKLQLK